MNISVEFFVFDLPPDFADAKLTLDVGATVNDVMDACLEIFAQRQAFMDENELRTATVIVDGKWMNPDDPVNDGDIVRIIRPMDGG